MTYTEILYEIRERVAINGSVADLEMFKSFSSDDFREGVQHFVEKRPPAFTGR